MKNIIIILMVLILPVAAYITLDNTRNKDIISEAQAGNKPVVMIFSSTMCSDCQKMKKIIDIVEPNYKDKVDFMKINASLPDENIQSMVKKYKVMLVPTIIFIDKSGNQKIRKEGSMPQSEFEKNLKVIING